MACALNKVTNEQIICNDLLVPEEGDMRKELITSHPSWKYVHVKIDTHIELNKKKYETLSDKCVN